MYVFSSALTLYGDISCGMLLVFGACCLFLQYWGRSGGLTQEEQENIRSETLLQQIQQRRQARLERQNQILRNLLAAHSDDKEESANNQNNYARADQEEGDNANNGTLRDLLGHDEREDTTNAAARGTCTEKFRGDR